MFPSTESTQNSHMKGETFVQVFPTLNTEDKLLFTLKGEQSQRVNSLLSPMNLGSHLIF